MSFSRRVFNYGLVSSAAVLGSPFQRVSASVEASQSKSMLELQQSFADLRFGMFVHFNMATFQDREWGDPTSQPSLFRPTALDTDQWAAAAKSAKMGARAVIPPERQSRWDAIRHLRNEASHPADQSILPPGEALNVLDIAVELINPLFTAPTPKNP